MALSVVVVSFRTGPVLDSCIAALQGCAAIRDVVLVDNGNPREVEAALDALAAAEPRLRIVRGQGNVGFAAGCNLGAARAASERLLFVNPDAVLHPEAPALLAQTLDATPGLAVVGGDLRCAEGRPEPAARRARVTPWTAFVSFSGLSRLGRWFHLFRDMHEVGAVADRPIPVSAISGALFAMRRADFEALGGFDDAYFLHVEDIDLCRRAEEAGGVVLFAPGPHGVHQRSSSDAPAEVVARHKAESFKRYFYKFARSPWERLGASVAGAILAVVLPLRARA